MPFKLGLRHFCCTEVSCVKAQRQHGGLKLMCCWCNSESAREVVIEAKWAMCAKTSWHHGARCSNQRHHVCNRSHMWDWSTSVWYVWISNDKQQFNKNIFCRLQGAMTMWKGLQRRNGQYAKELAGITEPATQTSGAVVIQVIAWWCERTLIQGFTTCSACVNTSEIKRC